MNCKSILRIVGVSGAIRASYSSQAGHHGAIRAFSGSASLGRPCEQAFEGSATRSIPLAMLLASSAAGAGMLFAGRAHSDATMNVPISMDTSGDSSNVVTTPLQIVEPDTQMSFPTALSPNEKLVGLGCRHMRSIVKVYAIGVYMDLLELRTALSAWDRFNAEELEKADAVWTTLCDVSMAKTFRLVVVRQVPGYHMASGFERALVGRAMDRAKQVGGRTPKEVKKEVKRFCAWFSDVGNMKIGSVVTMNVREGGADLTIDGRWMGRVEDDCLAWALGDMFMGETAVVPTLRGDVAQTVHAIVAGRQKQT